jgi:hypothetical protein
MGKASKSNAVIYMHDVSQRQQLYVLSLKSKHCILGDRMISISSRLAGWRVWLLLVTAAIIFSALQPRAQAAEDGKGIYLPGLKGSMAGFVPPPGTYGSSYKVYYSGGTSGAAANGIALDQVGPPMGS